MRNIRSNKRDAVIRWDETEYNGGHHQLQSSEVAYAVAHGVLGINTRECADLSKVPR